MNVLNLTRDEQGDRAVSPVVGVALLVAMTVILAAVIAMVVLGLGAGMAEAPQATLSFQVDGTDLVMSHDGGDRLVGDHVVIIVDGGAPVALGTDLTAGNTHTITGAGTADTVRVVWQDPNSDSESVIGTYRA